LQGRALWFAAQYADALPVAFIQQFLNGSVEALKSSSPSPIVHVFAMKAIVTFCSQLQKDILKPFQKGWLESLSCWAPHVADEALILLLEALNSVIKVLYILLTLKIDLCVTAEYEGVITPLLVTIWSRGCNGISFDLST
jgi:hypothetical protein